MDKIIDSSVVKLNYLYVDKYLFPSTWGYPETKTPYAMLRFITKGSGKFLIDSKEIFIEENSLIYIPEGCMLSCDAITDWFEFISVRFTTVIRNENINIFWDELSTYVKINNVEKEIVEYFFKIIDESNFEKAGSGYAIRGYLDLIFAYLLNEIAKTKVNYNNKEVLIDKDKEKDSIKKIIERNIKSAVKTDIRIQTVLEYLILHQQEQIELSDIYNMIDISPSSFRRLFKNNTGKTLGEFICEMKMMAAAKRLLSTEDRISSIAYDIGFDCPNYFTRQFKKRFGVSPQTYRYQSRI